jgi:dihydroflavonol-4-reductase
MIAAPILLTGGLGFLGSRVAANLLAAGEAVRILARPPARPSAPPPSPYELVWGDIRDPEAVDRAVRGAGAVIHLASQTDGSEAFAVNVEGTRNLLDASVRHGVGHFVHCSTIGVHGSLREIPGHEDTPFNPANTYEQSKLAAEMEVWRCHRERGLPVTVLRPASITGPGDLRMLKLLRLLQRRWFVMVGPGRALFQPVYVDDVADAFRLCLRNERAIGEAFIIGGEDYLPIAELVDLAAAELGVPRPRLRVPLKPVLLLAFLCEHCCHPFGIRPPLHRGRVGFFHNNRAFSIAKARRVLGFQPRTSLRQGLRTTISWYRSQGKLAAARPQATPA